MTRLPSRINWPCEKKKINKTDCENNQQFIEYSLSLIDVCLSVCLSVSLSVYLLRVMYTHRCAKFLPEANECSSEGTQWVRECVCLFQGPFLTGRTSKVLQFRFIGKYLWQTDLDLDKVGCNTLSVGFLWLFHAALQNLFNVFNEIHSVKKGLAHPLSIQRL